MKVSRKGKAWYTEGSKREASVDKDCDKLSIDNASYRVHVDSVHWGLQHGRSGRRRGSAYTMQGLRGPDKKFVM